MICGVLMFGTIVSTMYVYIVENHYKNKLNFRTLHPKPSADQIEIEYEIKYQIDELDDEMEDK